MSEMLPTEQEAALALITANGNTNLAAERLKITPQKLIMLLSSSDLSRLNLQIKATLAIRSFTLLNKLQDALEAYITDMDPKDIARAYTTLLNTLPNLLPSTPTNTPTPNTPITPEQILATLPEDIRKIIYEELA